MVEIPAGRFLMGDRKERVHFPQAGGLRVNRSCSPRLPFHQDGEGPVRPVTMSSFWMDRFEVSNEKWQDFASETGYLTDAERLGDSFVAELYLSKAVNATIEKKVDAVPWWLPVPNASWQKPEGIDARQAREVLLLLCFCRCCRLMAIGPPTSLALETFRIVL